MVANILFAMEIMVKLTGFGPWYFHSMWNRFDFVTTCVTLFFAGSAFSSMRVVRFVRVFRVLHTLKARPRRLPPALSCLNTLQSLL